MVAKECSISCLQKYRKFSESIHLDLRALALFRIFAGAVILCDLAFRYHDLEAHYTNHGVIPLKFLKELWRNNFAFSFHAWNGSADWQRLLFFIAGLFAVSFTLGFKTKISHFATWLLMLSLHSRNSQILFGADTVMRVILFWSLFLPLAEKLSIDSWIKKTPPRTMKISNAATFAFLFQMALIYFFAGFAKIHPVWYREMSGLQNALNLEQYATPLGQTLVILPTLLKILTFATFCLELVAPFLFFFWFKNSLFRTMSVFLLILFHAATALAFSLGIFPFICSAALIAILPSSFFGIDSDSKDYFSGNLTQPLKLFIYATCFYVLIFNISNLKFEWKLPFAAQQFAHLTGLKQRWNLFAPYPDKQSGWFIIEGKNRVGETLTVYDPNTAFLHLPTRANIYKDARWIKYFMELRQDRNQKQRMHFARFVCRQWNRQHSSDEQLIRVSIYSKFRDTTTVYGGYEVKLAVEQDCGRHQN